MSLKDYKKKRNLENTPEPAGKKRLSKNAAAKPLIFVVQKHAASHLHYDFRLEVDGVLKSWAVPKGPSLNPSDKRLAIMVEDHPYDYHDFEGTIPKGNYGAGTVMVWDTGSYYPLIEYNKPGNEKTISDGLQAGEIKFILEGQKLTGAFTLVKLKKHDDQDRNWLLIKSNDPSSSKEDVIFKDRSVISNQTMEEIGGETSLKIKKTSEGKKKPQNKTPQPNTPQLKHIAKTKMPHHVKPMLAYLVDEPFDDNEWLFEIKWDGFRAIAEINQDNILLYSRSFQPFNERFSPVVNALKELSIQAIFDGEVVIIDKNGKSDFQLLQNYQKTGKGDLRYYVYDLLYYNGHDLMSLPLLERKQILQTLIPNSPTSLIQFSDHILTQGVKFFNAIKKRNFEGVMAKNIFSHYHSKRSREWLKIKTHARQEAIICGFTAPKGSRQKFGALILGIFEDHSFRYIGHVGGGFNQKSLNEIMDQLQPLITEKCPFKVVPKTNTAVTWVKPKLLCEVSFAEWTKEGQMRQPIFLGIRTDKKPTETKKETALSINEIPEKNKKKPSLKQTKSSKNLDLSLTHLEKVYFPKDGFTKGDLINYYREVSSFILPYLKDRPQVLHRFPNGIEEDGFYQKNLIDNVPEWIHTVEVTHENKNVNYLLIPDEKSLLFAVNLGCIDLNPFNSRIQNLNCPDYAILDLDPESISFDKVIEAAQVIHEILTEADIPCYCKTSGATGLHIYIPLGAKYTHEQAKQFAQLIALLTHQRLPKSTSMERSPSKRQKKVYLDYLQNNFGQTLAAPYSVRPRSGATVSTPLEWTEVKKGLDPRDFNIETVLKRFKNKKNIFLPVLKKGINLQAFLEREIIKK